MDQLPNFVMMNFKPEPKATQVALRCDCGTLSILPVCTYETMPCPACKGFGGAVTFLYSPQAQPIQDGQASSESAQTSPQRLNPAFAAWLMGWPSWWGHPDVTNCAASAMASFRCALRSRLLDFYGE